jgi:leucyl-tRNA synthetase
MDATEADLQAAADASPVVQKAIDGREIVRVIIRTPKLINIVTKG